VRRSSGKYWRATPAGRAGRAAFPAITRTCSGRNPEDGDEVANESTRKSPTPRELQRRALKALSRRSEAMKAGKYPLAGANFTKLQHSFD